MFPRSILNIGFGIYNTLYLVLLFSTIGLGQEHMIEGYTYETGNRGYLSQVNIEALDTKTGQSLLHTMSNNEGYFSLDLPPINEVTLKFSKEMFQSVDRQIKLDGKNQFVKLEMERTPGYLFEITLADKRLNNEQSVDAITGALIEVYNNTTEKIVMRLENHPSPEFNLPMQKGNHYTILVRKEGYLAKQMEAYVNVNGCILCFEGVHEIKPGVTVNLTSGNEYGCILANVEMERIYSGKSFEIKDLYYDLNSAALRNKSKIELDKVIELMKYNPNLTIELGSHTDARGGDKFNLDLSERRAASAVEYIKDKGHIPSFRIIAKGYGESLLKNECSDGVYCKEDKHQENRRTEVKILGVDEKWVFKPLENIKNEINFERELFELLHGDQEKWTNEDYHKLQMMEREATLPLSKEKPILMDQNVNKQETSQSIIQEDNVMDTTDVSIKEESVRRTDEKSKQIEDMPSDAIVPAGRPAQKISDGYKIIIHYSAIPLDESNPLFKSHANLELYISPENNYYYMIPGFGSSVEAEQILQEKYINDYPSAYIAGFKYGRRIR